MPTEVERLLIKLSADTHGYETDMTRAERKARSVAKSMTNSLKEQNRITQQILRSVSNEWIRALTPMQKYQAQLSGLFRLYQRGVISQGQYNKMEGLIRAPVDRETKKQMDNMAKALAIMAREAAKAQKEAARESEMAWRRMAIALREAAKGAAKEQNEAARKAAQGWKNFAAGLKAAAQGEAKIRRDQARQAAEVAKIQERLRSEAYQLWQRSLPPMQRHQHEMNRINALYRQGYLTLGQYRQAMGYVNRMYGQGVLKNVLHFLGGAGIGGGALGMYTVAGAAGAATAAVGRLIAKMVDLATTGAMAAIKLAAEFELVQISFRVLLKDADTADKVLRDVRQFANETPFLFPELAEASKALSAYGIEAAQLLPTLKMLGELSAGMNIPMEELTRLYGRNRAQMRLYQRDINEFQGRGIPILDEFQKMFGKTAAEIRKMTQEGKINFGHLQQALINLTTGTGRFAGLTDELSQTAIGRWSTMKDAVLELGRTVGKYLLDSGIKEYLEDMIAFLTQVNKGWKDVEVELRLMGIAFENLTSIPAFHMLYEMYMAPFREAMQAEKMVRSAIEAANDALVEDYKRRFEELAKARSKWEGMLAGETDEGKRRGILAHLEEIIKLEDELAEQRERLKEAQVLPDIEDPAVIAGRIAYQELEEEMQKLQEEDQKLADQIKENNRTAWEEYQDSVAGLDRLLIKGLITEELYRKELERIKGVLKDNREKERAKEIGATAVAVEELNKKLKEQIELFGLTGPEAEIKKLEREGAKPEELETARARAKELEELERLKKEQEEIDKLNEAGVPKMEAYNKRVEQLNKWLEEGKLTAEGYAEAMRAAAAALGEVDKAMEKNMSVDDLWITAWKKAFGFAEKATGDLLGAIAQPNDAEMEAVNRRFKPEDFEIPAIPQPHDMGPMPSVDPNLVPKPDVERIPLAREIGPVEVLPFNPNDAAAVGALGRALELGFPVDRMSVLEELLGEIANNTGEDAKVEIKPADFGG